MARRRPKAREAVEEQLAEREEPQQQPESDNQDSDPAEDQTEEDAPQDIDQHDKDDEVKSLQFNEELSWRPAKPIPTGTLIPRLEKLSNELSAFDQGAVDLDSVKDVAEKLAHRHLLQHKDSGVKAYTACCLVDILRLFVPDAPFTSDQLKVR